MTHNLVPSSSTNHQLTSNRDMLDFFATFQRIRQDNGFSTLAKQQHLGFLLLLFYSKKENY
jgi:hypothetical protein